MKYRGREHLMLTLVVVLAVIATAVMFGPRVVHAISHASHAADSLGAMGMGTMGLGLVVGATRDLNKTYLYRGQSFGPGKGILVPDGFPEIDKKTGAVIHPKGSQAALNQEMRVSHGAVLNMAPPPTISKPEASDDVGTDTASGKTREELASMSKSEMEALAREKNITVARADGREDLEPTVADYQAALGADIKG